MTRIRTEEVYKGISFPFRKGSAQYPERSTDAALVKESLVQLIQTAKSERVMRPDAGSGAWSYVFENNDEILEALIRTDISALVAKYESRVKLIDVITVRADTGIWVTLVYYIPALQQEDQLTTTLTSTG